MKKLLLIIMLFTSILFVAGCNKKVEMARAQTTNFEIIDGIFTNERPENLLSVGIVYAYCFPYELFNSKGSLDDLIYLFEVTILKAVTNETGINKTVNVYDVEVPKKYVDEAKNFSITIKNQKYRPLYSSTKLF